MTILIFFFVIFLFLFNVFLFSGGKFESRLEQSIYKVDMILHIRSVGPADYRSYKCVAKNSLGETDGTIKVYSEFNYYY